VDSINTTSFWEGLKATAQTLWDKRNLIATTTSEVAQFITDPSKYVNDRFWTSDIGTQFMQEIGDYYGETNLTNQFLTIADNAATGGVVSVFETVGYDNLWTGVKEVSEFVWDNRNGIIGNVAEISSLVSNPYDYLWGKYLDTSTGKASQDQMLEFFGLKEPNTKVEIDYITKTVKVDPELNYGNIFERPVLGFLDGVMLLRTANFRYDRATYNAGLKCDGLGNDLLDGKIRGFSISGINTDGAKLDELTRDLAAAFLGTYSLTHSAGSSARIKSNVWTEKNIMISPQEKRIDVESWMDQMGYTSDNVLIVDVAGDLPYRPADVANIGLDDILNPATFVDTGFLAQNIVDIVKDNAYNDYSQNPNSKYTYVRIIDGSGIDYDLDIIENHSVGVDGALDLNAKYSISVNGLLLEGEHRLSDIYGKFLRGEL
ncbi:MAG: hypothetical protein P9L90_05870, partial [Candidatus Aadella gelida]|nr:hypothetical protein [Candidatus Aadella gelida]